MIIAIALAGVVGLKLTELGSNWLVKRKEVRELVSWVDEHPSYILIPAVPARLYDHPLRKRMVEGARPASDERKLAIVKQAESDAEKYGPLIRQLETQNRA